MHVAAISVELRLPGCMSLKEKRRRLRPILDHLRRRMELSVSEVAFHDAWQRAGVGVAVVAPQAGRLDEVVERLRGWLLAQDDVDMVSFDVSYLEQS